MNTMTVFALILFALTYVLMFAFQKTRPYVALTSAVIFVVVGSLGVFPDFTYTAAEALGQIDWNVLLMIAGLGILRKEGIEVKASQFMKYSVPFTLTAVIAGYVLVWLIWM